MGHDGIGERSVPIQSNLTESRRRLRDWRVPDVYEDLRLSGSDSVTEWGSNSVTFRPQ